MKMTTAITIDMELYEKAKERKINLSGTINKLLTDYLNTGSELERLKRERNEAASKLNSLEERVASITTESIKEEEEKQEEKSSELARLTKRLAMYQESLARGTTLGGKPITPGGIELLEKQVSDMKRRIAELNVDEVGNVE